MMRFSYITEQLKNKKIIFSIDNQSVVHIIKKKSSKSVRVMSLVRHLVLSTLQYNIMIESISVVKVSRDGLVFRCLVGLPLDKGSGNAANHNEIKNQQFYLKFQK
jgi:hypothetical protein